MVHPYSEGVAYMRRILFLVLLLAGCRNDLPMDAVQGKALPSVAYAPQISPRFWAIRHTNCIDCHGASPFPASIDLRTKSSLTSGQVQAVYDGIAELDT